MQPRQFKIPDWFLNRQKDVRDGKFFQIHSNHLEAKIRDDLERLKKIRYVACPPVMHMESSCVFAKQPHNLTSNLWLMLYASAHRGMRHFWGLRVRGQHTKTTGRKGRTVGVSKKKGG